MTAMLIAQLTDLHVRPLGQPAYRVSETNMMTARALHHVATLRPAPDVVLITGDLTDNGLADEYDHLAQMIVASGLPTPLVIPGNHDRRETMRAHLPFLARHATEDAFLHYAVEDLAVRIVMLDTVVPGASHGALCPARLAWLEATLAAAPDRPTLIAMHHPPFATGIAHMDGIALRAPEDFAAVIGKHPQVQRIICGHVHRPILAQVAHCPAMICPSVTHQVALDLSPDGRSAFMLEPPAYGLHLWDGSRFVSHVGMVERYPGPFPFVLDESYPGRA